MELTKSYARILIANLLSIIPMLFFISCADKPMLCGIRRVFSRYNFDRKSGLLQFWLCCNSYSEYNVKLIGQPFVSTQDHEGLENYRRNCLDQDYPIVGLENVGNWFAGRAVQTRISDYRTLTTDHQHSADMGQLVMPVSIDRGPEKELLGVIELVWAEPKESYIPDFEQLQNLLRNEGLYAEYMGKMIKVTYGRDTVKFPLPLSAKFTDLCNEVMMRFEKLKHTPFCIMYNNTPISDDEALGVCLKESSSNAIYMSVTR